METVRDEIVEELVSIILAQDRKIKKLERKIERIMQYVDVYEEYIKKKDDK